MQCTDWGFTEGQAFVISMVAMLPLMILLLMYLSGYWTPTARLNRIMIRRIKAEMKNPFLVNKERSRYRVDLCSGAIKEVKHRG